MKPKLLIAGYYGYGNAGDEAILASMIADLRSVIANVDLCVVSADPEATQNLLGVNTINPSNVEGLMEVVRDSDLVILGGGGIFHDYWRFDTDNLMTEEQEGLAFYLSIPQLAALYCVPCMLYAVGFGPLGDPSIRDQIVRALSTVQLITVRDSESVEVLRSIGLMNILADRCIVQTADPAFNTPLPSTESAPQVFLKHGIPLDVPRIAVNLRYWDFGVDPENWESEVAHALDQWITHTSGHIIFVPFQDGGHPPYGNDSEVCERVREMMQCSGATSRLEVVERPGVYVEIFSHVDLVLTMRMHGVVFSLLSGTPMVALAYDLKVDSLLHQFELGMLSLPVSDWSTANIINALNAAEETSKETNIRGGVEQAQKLARKNAIFARDLLTAGPKELDDFGVGEGIRKLALQKIVQVLRVQKLLHSKQAELDRLLSIEQDYEVSKERLTSLSQDLVKREASIDRLETMVKDLEGSIQDQKRTHEREIRAVEEKVEEERARYRQEISKRADEIKSLKAMLAEREVRSTQLEYELTELRSTIAVRVMARYWEWSRRAIPPGTRRHTLYRKIRGRIWSFASQGRGREAPGLSAQPSHARDDIVFNKPQQEQTLRKFMHQMRQRGSTSTIMILSATPLEESEGQRSTHLAFEFASRGFAVVFAHWRWADTDIRPQDRVEQGIYQLPLDEVIENPMAVLDAGAEFDERVLIFEFPYPAFFDIVSYGNANGWITVYDVVDDWDGFHSVGQAEWFEEMFEAHLVFASDIVIAVNDGLRTRLERFTCRVIPLIPNGVAEGITEISSEVELERGEITLGYFGYLSSAWFDWDLIRIIGREHPSWRVYLIGYGGDQEHQHLPNNVIFLGKKPWKSLAAYAANWDLGIIPFKPGLVSHGADPIKAYEYLALGLPVVATGVNPPDGAEDYFFSAEDAREFMDSVQIASQYALDGEALGTYVQGCVWSKRVDEIINLIAAGSSRVAEKRALAKR